jgi:hypothetical protein
LVSARSPARPVLSPSLLDAESSLSGGGDWMLESGRSARVVENIAASSFSSCILRFCLTPTRGCEQRVIEQLLTGCKYVKAGIRALDRYRPA